MTTTFATLLSIVLAGAAGSSTQSALDTVRGQSSAPTSVRERSSRSVDIVADHSTSAVGRTLRDLARAGLVLDGPAAESPQTIAALGLATTHAARLTATVLVP